MQKPPAWLRDPRAGPVLLLALVWCLFVGPTLLGKAPYDRDMLVLFLPIKAYLRERLLRGEWPAWYPYETLGVPFIGQVVDGTFHPQTLLFLAFSPPVALAANIAAGYGGALAGAYKAGRLLGATRPAAVAGACAFACGGYNVAVSNNLPYFIGSCTLPWVLWAALRLGSKRRSRDAALLGLLIASVFLAGDAQTFVLSFLLLLVSLLICGVSVRLLMLQAAAAVIALLLIAVEVLPSLSIFHVSIRRLWFGTDMIGYGWALHPWRLLELVIPSFTPALVSDRMGGELYGDRAGVWASTLFAGGTTVLAAAAGVGFRDRRRRALTGLVAITVWLSMGHRLGLLRVAWRILPPLGGFRYPEKYLVISWLGLAMLAALGIDRLRAGSTRWRMGALLSAALLLLFAALLRGETIAWIWTTVGRHLEPQDPLRGLLLLVWPRGARTTGGVLVCAAALLHFSRGRPWLSWGWPALVFVELWLGNGFVTRTALTAAFKDAGPFAPIIRASAPPGGPPGRVTGLGEGRIVSVGVYDDEAVVLGNIEKLLPDVAGMFHVPAFGMAFPGVSERDWTVFGENAVASRGNSPRFNGCFLIVSLAEQLGPEERVLARDDLLQLQLVQRPCSPRAFLAEAVPVADLAAARDATQWLWPGAAVWEGGPALQGSTGSIEWIEHREERVTLRTKVAGATALILNDSPFGWSATIDGVSAPLYPANVAASGVAIPAGDHQLTFTYRIPHFREGLLLSAIGLLLAMGLLLHGGGQRGVAPRLPTRV